LDYTNQIKFPCHSAYLNFRLYLNVYHFGNPLIPRGLIIQNVNPLPIKLMIEQAMRKNYGRNITLFVNVISMFFNFRYQSSFCLTDVRSFTILAINFIHDILLGLDLSILSLPVFMNMLVWRMLGMMKAMRHPNFIGNGFERIKNVFNERNREKYLFWGSSKVCWMTETLRFLLG